MDDLRTIAKRYLADDDQCQDAFLKDAFALADFATSLLDDAPLTKQWLVSVGGVERDHLQKIRFSRIDALPVGLWHVDDGWKVMLELAEHHHVCIVRGLNNQGQFRRLADALQIKLKEPNDV